MPPRPRHRPLSLAGSHWRSDGTAKVVYSSEREAAAVAADRGREHGIELGVYRCDFCRGWHLGGADGRSEAARRR